MAGQNILIVEDEDDIAELLEYNLTRHGFEAGGDLVQTVRGIGYKMGD